MANVKDLSDEELLLEWAELDRRIKIAPHWGAALGAMDEFRRECEREIALRNLRVKCAPDNRLRGCAP